MLLTFGEPLPFERTRRKELGLPPTWDEATESEDDQDEWKWAAFDLAPEIAAALGDSPLTLTADTGAWHRVLPITDAAVADRAADGGPREPR